MMVQDGVWPLPSLTIMPDQQQQGHRVIEKAEVRRMMMMVVIADGERG